MKHNIGDIYPVLLQFLLRYMNQMNPKIGVIYLPYPTIVPIKVDEA